jgi:hypothetical protein
MMWRERTNCGLIDQVVGVVGQRWAIKGRDIVSDKILRAPCRLVFPPLALDINAPIPR